MSPTSSPPRQPLIPLEPQRIGVLFRASFRFLGRSWRALFALSLLLAVIGATVSTAVNMWLAPLTNTPAANTAETVTLSGTLTAMMLSFTISLFLALVARGFFAPTVADEILEPAPRKQRRTLQPPAGAQPRSRVLATALLTAVITAAPLLVLVLILNNLTEQPQTYNPALGLLLSFIVGVSVVGAIWLYVVFAYAPITAAMEETPVKLSLQRSRSLTKRRWWRTFGVLILFEFTAAAITLVITVALTFPVSLFWILGNVDLNQLDPATMQPVVEQAQLALNNMWWLDWATNLLVMLIAIPFGAAFLTLAYIDLRLRDENLAQRLRPATRPPHPG